MAAEAKIYSAICAVMAELGAIGKDKFNQIQKYKFRGIDDVYNALHPVMAKHHVFVTPDILEERREERPSQKGGVLIYSVVKVKYRFYADDGSFVEATVIGEAMDSGDKSMNKAMSAAYKYACFQTFCIPTEEMLDSENDSPDPTPREAPQQDMAEKVLADIQREAKWNDPVSFEHLKWLKAEALRHQVTEEAVCSVLGVAELKAMTNKKLYALLTKEGCWDKVREYYEQHKQAS